MKYHTSHKSILGLLIALLVAVSAASAQNSTVTFDLRTLQSGVKSSTITGSDGVTTLTISGTTNLSVHNVTGFRIFSGFGVDREFSYDFSQNVTIQSYVVTTSNAYTGNESYQLRIDSGTPITEDVPDNMVTGNSYSFVNQLNIDSNSILRIASVNDNISGELHWQTLTVTVVPEPSTYALFLGFGAFVFIMIRHRRRD